MPRQQATSPYYFFLEHLFYTARDGEARTQLDNIPNRLLD